MKKILSFLIVVSILFSSCSKEEKVDEVVVYTYSSFSGEWGAGPKVAKLFEEKTGTRVRFITCKDASSIVTSAFQEKAEPKADVALGIDNYLLGKAIKLDILSPYKAKRANEIEPNLIMSDEDLITPFDFGYFAFMYNTTSELPPPKSLKDLLDKRYKGKIVLMNPMTSTPGLGVLLWMHEVFGSSYIEKWKELNNNVLSMPTSWSQGYSLFTSGEVPLVISYTTSLAAHLLYDKTEKFQPLIFEEGHLSQIEGVALLKGAVNAEKGKEFIDFMLSDEVQSIIGETQFMFPVMKSVKLPSTFSSIPSPQKVLKFESENIEKVISDAMNAVK